MGETTYTVFLDVPYEGLVDIFIGTLDKVKEWLPTCGYSRDDLTLYSNDAPDIYSL